MTPTHFHGATKTRSAALDYSAKEEIVLPVRARRSAVHLLLPHVVARATVCAAVTQRVVGLNGGRHVQPLAYPRARHEPEEPTWSERRRYCRDEYDDSTGSPFIEVVVARICLVAGVIVIGLAVWFA